MLNKNLILIFILMFTQHFNVKNQRTTYGKYNLSARFLRSTAARIHLFPHASILQQEMPVHIFHHLFFALSFDFSHSTRIEKNQKKKKSKKWRLRKAWFIARRGQQRRNNEDQLEDCMSTIGERFYVQGKNEVTVLSETTRR